MCSCNSKINGRKGRKTVKKMAKRKYRGVRGLNKKDIMPVATAAVIGGAGAVILKMVMEKTLPANLQRHTNYGLIAGGVLLAVATGNPMIAAAGLGAATVGAANVVGDLVDGQVNGLGLLGPGIPSVRIAGRYDAGDSIVTQ